MDTAIKIAQLVFFLVSIGTMSYLGITAFLKERQWKRERKEAEERHQEFDKFTRELMGRMSEQMAGGRPIVFDSRTVN
jgi:hypothetical protein